MEYYFVVLDGSEQIESVIQRAVGKAPAKMAGKKFVKADGVRLTFYYRLKEVDSYVTLTQVMSYGQSV